MYKTRTLGVLGLLTFAAMGCGSDSVRGQLSAATAGAGSGGAVAGAGGQSGSSTASGGSTVSGSGGAVVEGDVTACAPFRLKSALSVAPAAAGQQYVRCDTLGPEAGWKVFLSPDGTRMAALNAAGTVHLIATNPWRDLALIASPLGAIDAVAFSPSGDVLATLSQELGEIALWNSSDGKLQQVFAGPPVSSIVPLEGKPAALAFSNDSRQLATSLGIVAVRRFNYTFDWRTGETVSFSLAVNPESFAITGFVSDLRFVADNSRLFVRTDFRIGNSPPSTRLELRDYVAGTGITLFQVFQRALLGYAISPDARFIAIGKSIEADVGGFTPGLTVYDAGTGAVVAQKTDFTGTVLGFSPDSQRLFTRADSTVTVYAISDLSVVNQFAWAPTFVGVSPAGLLVGSQPGSTSFTDPATGAVVRTFPFQLSQISWSVSGEFAAGTGDPFALFHFWREPNGAELCMLRQSGYPAPALASLGTTLDANGSGASENGQIVVTNDFITRANSQDWFSLHVRQASSGELLRVFPANFGGNPGMAISRPAGERLYTPQGESDIAVWCR